MGAEVFRRVHLYHFSALHDGDCIAELEGLINIMGDKYDSFVQLPLDLQQLKLHVFAHQRIQSRERFIHQQHIRVGGQRAGDGHALTHAAGEAVTALMLPAGEAYHG
ncbi:hypothetical protein SDC9_163582 [bioreactor metagenome]|uniref:Uncharacterized protein n=1 Tax=bioreactor metagenome TaxID=1076179 RepID=A0A645FW35_9ZZZZ